MPRISDYNTVDKLLGHRQHRGRPFLHGGTLIHDINIRPTRLARALSTCNRAG